MPHSQRFVHSKDLAYVHCCGMLEPRVQTTMWHWPLSVKADIVQTMSQWQAILKHRKQYDERKINEMHIQGKVNHMVRISMLLLHVSALYERRNM
jgi:hypothetical protein